MTATTTAPVRVYWQPGCTSCLKTKEYLTRRGVPYESVNVLESPGASDELRALGARGIPIVARGGRYVYAQSLDDVDGFLGLAADARRMLAPAVLADKLETVLATGVRLAAQVPDGGLERMMPNRPRSVRMLLHHIFRIGEVLLINVAERRLTMEMVVIEPPATMTLAELLDYGRDVHARVRGWAPQVPATDFTAPIDTFYGAKPLHEVLERTAWHAAQHVRQLEMVLPAMGVVPDGPLSAGTLAGLPVPEDIWDE